MSRVLSSGLWAGLCAGMVLFFPLQLLGAEQSTEYPTEYPTEQPHPSKRIEMLDTPRDYLAGKYVGLASKIDRFFGDSRNFQESNTSVLQIDLTRVSGYGGNNQYVLTAKARLRLPATEGRLHLLVESDPERNITSEEAKGQAGANKKVLNPQSNVAKPESYAAALRYEKTEESRWHNSADAGIQFSGISAPPNPFARARSSYTLPLDRWQLKASQSVFWFNSIGLGENTQMDLERFISEPLLFRASSNATWLYDSRNFDLRQDLSLYYTRDERTAVLYQASAIAVTRPQFQATDFVILMAYRYDLHRKWMFFEFSPQVHFPRTEKYEASPTLVVRLEMLFDGSQN